MKAAQERILDRGLLLHICLVVRILSGEIFACQQTCNCSVRFLLVTSFDEKNMHGWSPSVEKLRGSIVRNRAIFHIDACGDGARHVWLVVTILLVKHRMATDAGT